MEKEHIEQFTDKALKTTARSAVATALKRGIELSKEDNHRLAQLMLKEAPERLSAMVHKMKVEAQRADVLGGLKQKRVDPLVRSAASITLTHECIRWSESLINQMFPPEPAKQGGD